MSVNGQDFEKYIFWSFHQMNVAANNVKFYKINSSSTSFFNCQNDIVYMIFLQRRGMKIIKMSKMLEFTSGFVRNKVCYSLSFQVIGCVPFLLRKQLFLRCIMSCNLIRKCTLRKQQKKNWSKMP